MKVTTIKSKQLLYFVKYPEPGKVKTRLAKSVGAGEAAKMYRELAESNLNAITGSLDADRELVVMCDPPEREADVRAWLSPRFRYVAQEGEGLGERLRNAFSHAFRGGAAKVLALGSDTIGLNENHIQDALKRLDRKDVVLGPARDGGYYLIGLKHERPELFDDIPWSTRDVLEMTSRRIQESYLTHHLLETLEDLDDISSLKEFHGSSFTAGLRD